MNTLHRIKLVVVGGFLAVCSLDSPAASASSFAAIAAEITKPRSHYLGLATQGTFFQTNWLDDGIAILSPLGVTAAYGYQAGYSARPFVEYSIVLGGTEVMLHGLSVGLDVAVLGGQPRSFAVPGDTRISVDFPYRLGLFLAWNQGAYNINQLYQKPALSLGDEPPLEGEYIGAEVGTSFDWLAFGSASVSGKASYVMPFFSGASDQTGSIIRISIGAGVLL